MISVSIIVPVYNVEKYIERALNTLIQQTLENIEIICINDGSTDNSLMLLDKFSKLDKRIKIITQKNSGVSAARNKGLECANGEYIAFLDSDDCIDKDFLEKLYNSAKKNNCDIAAASIIRKRENSQKYRVHYETETISETLEEKIKVCDIPRCCYIWNKLYQRELIKDKKFKEGVYFEDVLWIPEVLKQSKRLVTVPETNYYYMVTKGSIVKTPTKKKQEDNYNAKKFLINFFEENNLDLSKKDKKLTKEVKYLYKIPICKIKEYQNIETCYLFGHLPIFKCKKNLQGRIIITFCGIRITLRKNKISEQKIKEINKSYEENCPENIYPKVKNSNATLQKLIETNCSIARYGDGEFNLILNESIVFQTNSQELTKRLKEVLRSTNSNVLIAIPDVFTSLDKYTDSTIKFWRKYLVYNRKIIYSLLNLEHQYFDSIVSRPYLGIKNKSECEQYFNDFKKVWDNKNVIFVEGEASRLGYKNDLFNNAKSIKRILCPATNAFDKYSEIFDFCITQPKDSLFILALGPTATVLAYDLAQQGFRALDLGHLDIEYEWFLQKVTEKIAIQNKYVNEAKGGRKITKIDDNDYKKEILMNLATKNGEI